MVRRATTLVLAATVSFFAMQPLPARAQSAAEGSAIVWVQDASSKKHIESEGASKKHSCRLLKSYFSAPSLFVPQSFPHPFDGRAPPFLLAAI
jgi:hypothetical protein